MTRVAASATVRDWSPSIGGLPLVWRLLLPAAAIAWTAVWWFYATANGHHRDMTWWAADMADLYAGRLAADGFYGYSPAFVQLVTPLRALPWEAAAWVWGGLMLAALVICARRWTPLAILAPPVLGELIIGNVHLLYAGAIVLGFRWPATWALMLLTKVTPGIGLLWFAARREWRALAVSLGATVAIAFASFVLLPDAWSAWLATLAASAQAQPLPIQPNALLPVPLVLRLPLAAAIVVWGALTDRRWTVAVAVVLALPVVWTAGLAVLVAAIPYVGRSRAAAARSRPSSNAG